LEPEISTPVQDAESVAEKWGPKRRFCRLEFKREDCWVGVFWKRDRLYYAYQERLDVWVCLLPMLPLHFGWVRYDMTPDSEHNDGGDDVR
jgi:hypothetical protein